MRRFALFVSLAAAGAIAAACSGGSTDATTGPGTPALADRHGGGWNEYHHTWVACRQFADDVMQDLFPLRMRVGVRMRIHDIRWEYARGQVANARNDMFTLWRDVLAAYYAGNLRGGQSADTQDNVLQFGQLLYCLVGLDGSDLALGDVLGSGDVTTVVFPSGGSQDVVHGSGNGGIRIPGGDLTQPATVTVALITDQFPPFAGPLNTKLDQYGPFFEFHVIPASAISAPVLVAECLTAPSGDNPPPSVHLAHNVGSGIEILGLQPSFLSCTGTSMRAPSMLEFLARGDLRGAARQFASNALGVITPRDAWAGSLGVGGKTTSFSPYGGVDTAVVVEAMSATTQLGLPGSPVGAAPTVRVRTTGALTPLDGANVAFAVTAGGGTLTAVGGGSPVTTVNAVTGTDGLAAVGSWTINTGANAVQASASFPAPPTGTGIGVNGNPVTFGATGGDPIAWEAAGYKYLAGPSDHDPGFESPSFSDASWAVGQAGFSDHLPPNTYCPIDTTGRTAWNSATPPTDMLLRHAFTLPSGYAGDLQLTVAIDNDIEVWVDGTAVTDGFVTHEGCAERGSVIIRIPNSALAAGTTNHLLAVRARDRGTAAFVDLDLSLAPPAP